MTNQQDTALLPVEQIKRALELWFFRELSDEQRRSLFRLAYGDRYASEATTHGHQRLSLRRVLRDIAAEQAKPSASCEAGEVERVVDIIDRGLSGPSHYGDPVLVEAHQQDMRAVAKEIITALRANATEAQGEVERLREVLGRLFNICDRNPHAQSVIRAALASGAGDEG